MKLQLFKTTIEIDFTDLTIVTQRRSNPARTKKFTSQDQLINFLIKRQKQENENFLRSLEKRVFVPSISNGTIFQNYDSNYLLVKQETRNFYLFYKTKDHSQVRKKIKHALGIQYIDTPTGKAVYMPNSI